jgi:two-component system, chemotaxis family, chemotaxis protein CheY
MALARFFVIGDNLLIKTLLGEILSGAGHRSVGESEHGAMALDRVLLTRPDLVVLDVVLLRSSALAELEQLMAFDPAPTVVVCSAILERRNAVAALHLGAKGLIAKPFNRRTVLETVHNALGPAALRESDLVPEPAAERAGVPDDERREFVRLTDALAVVIDVGEAAPIHASTVDLSGGGMLLATSALDVGDEVAFRLDLGIGEAPIAGRARVVRVTADGQSALEFERVHIADHERLTAYIARRATAQRLGGSARGSGAATPPHQ